MIRLTKNVVLMGCLLLPLAAQAQHLSEAEFKAQAQQKAMQLGKTLKQNLLQAVKAGGLPNGVQVCKEIAPAIAAELSTDGWQVGRTALKVRNPQNRADRWEQSSLMAMVEGLEEGLEPGALAMVHVDEAAGKYRFMAPIMADGLCLNCHGASLAEPVKEAINQQYPNDEATGFAAGDLRGAFTVTYQAGD